MSKASHGINLSEDVFAGFNATIRGHTVNFKEYVQVGNLFIYIHIFSNTCMLTYIDIPINIFACKMMHMDISIYIYLIINMYE
jgi:hypothetical protein